MGSLQLVVSAVVQQTEEFDGLIVAYRYAIGSLLHKGEYHPTSTPTLPIHIRNGVCVSDSVVTLLFPMSLFDFTIWHRDEGVTRMSGWAVLRWCGVWVVSSDEGLESKLARKPLGSWLVVGLR